MKLRKQRLYLMFLFSMVSAKPFTNNSTSTVENKTNDDIHKTGGRRQGQPCDYLYEDCDSVEYKYDKTNIKNKEIKEENFNQEKSFYHTEEKGLGKSHKNEKLSYVDSLENFNYDDIQIRPVKGPLNAPLPLRQEGTTSTPHMWFEMSPPETQVLPPSIAICNDKSRCRLPFNQTENI